tara:strand:+ start:605 stop:892 length:288 start_codon:yes stop_codon:yes gene_type:complete
MSNSLRLYTKDNCPYCDALKNKLNTWGVNFDTINISEDIESKYFLKEKGHRTVPQIYFNDHHLEHINVEQFTHEDLIHGMRSAWPGMDSGIEDMS